MITAIAILAFGFSAAIIMVILTIAVLRRRVEILESRVGDLEYNSRTIDENLCDCKEDIEHIKTFLVV